MPVALGTVNDVTASSMRPPKVHGACTAVIDSLESRAGPLVSRPQNDRIVSVRKSDWANAKVNEAVIADWSEDHYIDGAARIHELTTDLVKVLFFDGVHRTPATRSLASAAYANRHMADDQNQNHFLRIEGSFARAQSGDQEILPQSRLISRPSVKARWAL